MKKIILFVITLFSIYSCVNDNDDYRKDKKQAYEVPGAYLFSNAEKELTDLLVTSSYNYNVFRFLGQYWTETTYIDEVRFDLTKRAITQNYWNTLYVHVLDNLRQASVNIAATEAPNTYSPEEVETFDKIKQNQLAIIDLLEVYAFQVLVDTYGNVPYSQAFQPDVYPTPVYDDAAAIYEDLIKRATAATEKIDVSHGSFDASDFLYEGDPEEWKKFGNSLLIKLGIALADANPSLSIQAVNAGYAGGAVLDNSDNALFKYNETDYSPIYSNVFANGRNDFVGADTFINYLNTTNDPRISAYFQLYIERDKDGNIIASYYKGGEYGAGGNTVKNASKPGLFAYTPATSGVLMEAAEVNLYLAEAAARGGYSVGGSAESYHDAAVTLSFAFWNVPLDNYLIYNPYDASDWKKSIGLQAWVCLYNRVESWNTKRRLDYPKLNVGPKSYLKAVPIRFTYPLAEQTRNAVNWKAAVTAQNPDGKDVYDTPVFWDKN